MLDDRWLIAPFESGLRTDLKPWQIPADAFSTLKNAYVFRGRVRKRFGSRFTGAGAPTISDASFNSRLRHNLGLTTPDIPAISCHFAFAGVPGRATTWRAGQQFSIGSFTYTVISNLPGAQPMLRSDGAGLAAVATFNVTNGNVNITGIPLGVATAVYFYTATPVMGLDMLEIGAVGNQTAIAFDTQFAYRFTGASWARLVPPGVGSAQWRGTNLNFFWGCNWRGVTNNTHAYFVTNDNASVPAPGPLDDPMRVYLPVAGPPLVVGWNFFEPSFKVAGDWIASCKLIIQFKNRLNLFGTTEVDAAGANSTREVNRVRYSHNGDPLSATAFLEKGQVGYSGGGYLDAPTTEEIVSAEFIKDRLIVYFERSTYELAYTGNEILPFVWQKLNTELGSDASMSTIPFDKEVLTIGNYGIHACNGSNVERVDSSIPDQIFDVRSINDDNTRVCGIRDYFTEMAYWSYPSVTQPDTAAYPTKVLVFNYKTGSWAINDDCITAFGYFEQNTDRTWDTCLMSWAAANFAWNAGVAQPRSRKVLAGNQQGYVFTVEPDETTNASVMQISNIDSVNGHITIFNHCLADGDYIKIANTMWEVAGVTVQNANFYNEIFQVTVVSANTITIGVDLPIMWKYVGLGTVSRVSKIDIWSKQWNPYIDKGRNLTVNKITFCVGKTTDGEVSVDSFASSNQQSSLGVKILETAPYPSVPLEANEQRLWHPIYLSADGQNIQIRIFHTHDQMIDNAIVESDFNLEGLVLQTRATSANLI